MSTLERLVDEMTAYQAHRDATYAEAARRSRRPRITNAASGLVIAMLAACPITYVLAIFAGTFS